MRAELCLFVCEQMRKEAERVVELCAFDDVKIRSFPSRCGNPPIQWQDIEEHAEQMLPENICILGGTCLSTLKKNSDDRGSIREENQCFYYFSGSDLIDKFQRDGAYLLTPGWLARWRPRMQQWGFDQEHAREFFAESASNLVLLDTGVDPASLTLLREFADFTGLPAESITVGLDHFRLHLSNIVLTWRMKGLGATSQTEINRMQKQTSDYAMAMDLLNTLARSTTENDVINKIFDLFSMLFAPLKMCYLPFASGQATAECICCDHNSAKTKCNANRLSDLRKDYEWAESGRGFLLRFSDKDETLGVLEVEDLADTSRKEDYLNLSLSIMSVCVLAIKNARVFHRLTNAERDLKNYSESLEQANIDMRRFADDALDSSDVGIIVLDREFEIAWLNKRFEDFFDLQKADVLEKRIKDLIRDSIKNTVENPDLFEERLLATYHSDAGSKQFTCHIIPTNTRKERWLEHRSRPIRAGLFAGGRIEHYHDITDLSLAEGQLQQIEERNRALLDAVPDMIFEVSADGTYLDFVPGVDSDPVVGPDVFLGKKISDFLPEAVVHAQMHAITGTLETGESRSIEYQLTQSGETKTFEGRFAALGPDRVMAIVRDITTRKSLEDQLRQAQKMEAIGRLAGGVAHDFNNLLQVIMGYGEMVAMDVQDSPSTAARVNQIMNAADRAGSLAGQLLALSRRQVLKLEIVDIHSAIIDLTKLIRRLIGEDITLNLRCGPEVCMVRADRGQLDQILMNLCLNARDAMPDGGEISISTQITGFGRGFKASQYAASTGSSGLWVLMEVHDTGCGIDEEALQHIFEPFFTSKDPGEGTGLGLATVYGIVRQHGGLIDVESKPGKGTTLKVYFPLAETPEGTVDPETASPVLGGTETILLAEDEDIVRNLAVLILETAGYTVLSASDGEEALRIFKVHAENIDLLFLDVVMPKLGGPAAFNQAQEIRPEVCAVFTSGYAAEKTTILGEIIKQGTHFVPKPYSSSDLLQKVREALNGTSDE